MAQRIKDPALPLPTAAAQVTFVAQAHSLAWKLPNAGDGGSLKKKKSRSSHPIRIRPLAWEPPYAMGVTLKSKQTNKQKTPKKQNKRYLVLKKKK